MDKIHLMIQSTVKAYVVLMGLLLITFATANQIYNFKQNVAWDQQLEIEATCTTDLECEQLYGYDMNGNPIEELPQEIVL